MKIFVIFLLYCWDVHGKVNIIEDSNANKIANFIGELLNDSNQKYFSMIQDVTIVTISEEWNNNDLFYDVLNAAIKNNPVLISTSDYNFFLQTTRAPAFVIIFFDFEVSHFVFPFDHLFIHS